MAESIVLSLQSESIFITLLLTLLLIKSSSGHNECRDLSCGDQSIRFPFQLVKGMKDGCGYPGFCLYCTQKNETMLVHPTIKLQVFYIDYQSQIISLTDPENCLPNKFLNLYNFFTPHFQFGFEPPETNLSFFDCSSVGLRHLRNKYQIYSDSQDMISCPIYVSSPHESVLKLDLTSCTKMFNISASGSASELRWNRLSLRWSKPNCFECEAKGKKCKWKNNSTEGDIECFDCKGDKKKIHIPKSFIFAATGSVLLGLVVIIVFKIVCYFRKKEEDQTRVEKFLEDYRAPEVFSRNFGNVSYKSDIYSYGMLLLEMVGGRKNVDMSSAQDFHVLYPDWIHNLVDGDVHIHVEDEGDVKIAKKLAIVGLWCIQWQPVNRPSIKSVIQMLETGEENQLTVPPNPFHSTTSSTTSGLTSTRRPLELEVVHE